MTYRMSAWLALPRSERLLLAEAWLLLLGVKGALRCFPLSRIQDLLPRVFPGRRSGSSMAPDRLAWLVAAAARRHFWSVSCLERSLVLQTLLGRRTPAPELRIGVRREGDALRAHAWVEVGGLPVGEAPDIATRFPPLAKALPR